VTRHRTVQFVGLSVAAGAVAVAVALSGAAPGVSWFEGARPSPVAGGTPPSITAKPVARIAAVGDTGTGDLAERRTAQRMATESQQIPYDALVLLGDLIYEEGDAALVDNRITQPFADLVDDGATLIPVLGNHDYDSGEQQQILVALGRERSWYTQRIGPVRVVVLDSNLVDDPDQTRWLQLTLARPQPSATWTVVVMHHPAYSAGYHGSTASVQQAWSPLFAEYEVPLVLAGHDHDYQRSVLIDGVTYVVSGAGAKSRPTGQEDFTAVSASTLHFLDLLFYHDRVVGRAIDQSGLLVDTFTISR
jgi:3',5'-cyclic AMP phosphodiesterase CpdA